MKKKRILVLTDDLPWGHRSIAKAIYSYLKKNEAKENYVVEYAEVKMAFSELMTDFYVFLYRYMPLSNRLSNVMMENDILREMCLEAIDRDTQTPKKIVDKYKPDLIISAHFFHSHSLTRWRNKSDANFKLWTVVADPWTTNPLGFVKGADLHLVYDQVCADLGVKYGIDKDKILKTGWWTREEMYENKLKIKNERPVVFVGGGSLGTNSLIRLLPILMAVKNKCKIIFNTGTDKLAYSMVNEYIELFKKLKKDNLVQIKCLGWIENMAEVLAEVNIVFGKAGPNFLFDVVAAQKPFVAITHIGGQEDGNIDLIREKKLGWVKESMGEAENFLLKYLANPKKYNSKCAKEIKLEADNNKKSLPMILERIEKDITPPRALLQ